MTGHLLFAALSDELALRILAYFRNADRQVYRNCVSTLADKRNLRPIFVLKKPQQDQLAWLHKTLKMKFADEMADNLIQIWLMQDKKEMLIAFLDSVGIEHDGDGSVEGDFPETLDPDKTQAAVAALFEQFDAEEVRVYLHIFQKQRAGGFPELASVMEAEPRCQWPS